MHAGINFKKTPGRLPNKSWLKMDGRGGKALVI